MIDFLNVIKNRQNLCAFTILDGKQKKEITFEEYYDEVEKCAFTLKSVMGDLDGKHIGILANSTYEYTVLLSAIFFSRAVAVPLNIRESLDNISFAVANAEVEWLIIDKSREKDVESLDVSTICVEDALSGEERIELKDFSENEQNTSIMIIYTSGTTGNPKGVSISVENLFGDMKSIYNSSAPFEKTVGLKIYTNFPFYHIGGICGWISHFEHGCTTFLSNNPGNVLTDLENVEIDSAVVTPATINLWKKSISRGHLDRLGGAKLIVSAGAPADLNAIQVFLDNGIAYGQYYGMSESVGNITSNFDCINHIKSVGVPDPGVEVRIIDGEICVKSKSVMQGYYKNPDETDKTLLEGYLHTGDLGYIDNDGYVYITGRKKNLIILSGGENVSPEELEKKLNVCDYIYECKVYAYDDKICTDLYTDIGREEDVKQFVRELNKTLPIFKRIYKVNIQNAPLEKTASGKIKR